MQLSRISVVIPTYNRAPLLPRAIKSAIRETGPQDEILVIDDGSTDETEAVAAQFPQVSYCRVPHAGAGTARNQGSKIAQHDLIAFLDSDDEWTIGSLNLRRSLFRIRPELLFCFSGFASVKDNGVVEHGALAVWHEDRRPWNEILGPGRHLSDLGETLSPSRPDVMVHFGNIALNEMRASYISTSTVIVRRDMAGSALHFGEDIPTYEDWECFGRLALKGPCAYVDCETAVQHRHSGSRLTDADLLTCTATRLKILERVWGQNSEFQAFHANTYKQIVQQQRELLVRLLLSRGSRQGAVAEMREMDSVPLVYRFLGVLPGGMTRTLTLARRRMRARRERRLVLT